LPCARGEANDVGELCPYRTHEPESMEAWQAWDLALRCGGQLRLSQMVAIGVDFTAALQIATSLGHDVNATAEFLPAIETGMTTAFNEKLSSEIKNR
jgi:hypothetical protein